MTVFLQARWGLFYSILVQEQTPVLVAYLFDASLFLGP